jgi:DNA-directed RNA polymerase specialized sigma24 family protein
MAIRIQYGIVTPTPPLKLLMSDTNEPTPDFPYHNITDPAVQRAAMDVITSVEWMIVRCVRQLGIKPSNIHYDDIIQKCRLHLLNRSLPQFDRTKHTKISTFLHVCINRYVLQERRRLDRVRENTFVIRFDDYAPEDLTLDEFRPGRDERLSGAIEAASDDVHAHPEKYMTSRQAEVFRAVTTAEPGEKLQDIAKQLGFSRPSSLSIIMRRIRERIVEQVDIEGLPAELPEKIAA